MNEDTLFVTEDQLAEVVTMQPETAESRKYLIFVTDNLRLGVDAENVVEIINNHTVTFLPMVPGYIRGIINLRGQIIPIMDIRLRLGKPPREDSLIIVLNISGTHLGILVDSVDQMVDISKSELLPMPSHNTQRLVCGMCSLPDGSGTMMVLDCAQLLFNE